MPGMVGRGHVLGGELGLRGNRGVGCLGGTGALRITLGMRCGLFAWHDVDKEVEHVTLGERGGDVGPLEGAAFVLLGVDPGAHGQLRDEDIATLGE
jgi:hypothetical protein